MELINLFSLLISVVLLVVQIRPGAVLSPEVSRVTVTFDHGFLPLEGTLIRFKMLVRVWH